MTNFSSPPPPPPPPMPTGYGMPATKAPRPAVTVGAWLMVLGGAFMIIGSFLSWFEIDGETFTGFSDAGDSGTKDGPVFAALGAIALIFGFIQLSSKKILALGIIGIITSTLCLIPAVADQSDVNDLVDLGEAFGQDVSSGPGLYIVILGAVIAIIGSIATVAKRSA